jgi:maltooligosyltrehalose trehalohydrolase
VTFLENHDQVANAPSGRGERLHQVCDPGIYRAITAFWLLAPGTPMLFQGQEFASSAPFLYFADHHGDLKRAVRQGRALFMRQFPSLATRDAETALLDPAEKSTFDRCVLSDTERQGRGPVFALHRDLLRLRREDAAFRSPPRGWLDGAVLGPDTLVVRFFSADPRAASSLRASFSGDRLLVVNFGVDILIDPMSEPLLAPPRAMAWDLRWSSEDPTYGGLGTPPVDTPDGWRIPGHAAVVFAPRVS